ncbi:MAG: acyl-CoA thioesterase [Phycisphaerales bacterium]|nr:MAG: acyl-CoA thioesterase [Phycisphaerales bacterium]
MRDRARQRASEVGARLRGEAAGPVVRPASSGSVRVRVRYCECDPMNVAHHAAYVAWLEMARTELLRGSGVSYAALEHAGVFLVVTKLEVRYRRPVMYDDVVEVRSRVLKSGMAKLQHSYEVVVVERDAALGGMPTDTIAATAETTLACVDSKGVVSAMPEWLRGGADAGSGGVGGGGV